MNLEIDNRCEDFSLTQEEIEMFEKLCYEVLTQEELGDYFEISLSFVGNKEIRQLNKDFRGIDKVTDVLSFPFQEENFYPGLLGDIVISVDKAKEQAKEYGHSEEREILYLLVHSMLHLLGYDHMEKDEKKAMREKEEEILTSLGVSR